MVNLYSIKDRVTGKFGPIFHQETDEEAMRTFNSLKIKPGLINEHPEDYSVNYLGRYDLITGTLIPESVRQIVEKA